MTSVQGSSRAGQKVLRRHEADNSPAGVFYTRDQVEKARVAPFNRILDRIGAEHKQDEEYRRNDQTIRVFAGYCGREFRFVIDGWKWVDERATGPLRSRRGNGSIDFAIYVTGHQFAHVIGLCLEVLGQPTAPAGATPERQMELPFWPADARALPNELLRSALFNARNKTVPRRHWRATERAEIAVVGDGVIEYVGEELRQIDEKVWLQLIHLARGQSPGQPVEFVAAHFCDAIGWPLCKSSYDQLRTCLSRMQAASLTVASKRLGKGVSLSMIPRFAYENVMTKQRLQRWVVTVAPELVQLFGGQHFSWIEWQQRLALPDGIATWLHGFFSTHRDPMPVAVEELARGAGLSSPNARTKSDSIRRGLIELVEIGFLASFRVSKGMVYVERMRHGRTN